ncbi:MAG TPA: hypothetical protein VNO76_07050, partial [Thermoplasmata archaeon]|nr:hypothetical protein [Thermoplasmata archaeon]
MTDPTASPLADLESAIRGSKPDRAAQAALDVIRGKVPLADVVRSAGRVFAAHYDADSGAAPRALVALSSAVNLSAVLPARLHPLPVLQAVTFLAAEKKAGHPAKPPAIVSGEVTHLGRSFL